MSKSFNAKVKSLSLQKGDILVIQRSFNTPNNWEKLLSDAGRVAGINFNVPVVFVDDIDEIAVVRLGNG
jgi:hypothetical protein